MHSSKLLAVSYLQCCGHNGSVVTVHVLGTNGSVMYRATATLCIVLSASVQANFVSLQHSLYGKTQATVALIYPLST